jgi:glycosyltransferase involved in cell wall biosynthesis
MRDQIIIFAPDFKPMTGGVAEYTYQLARELNKLEVLDCVITTVIQDSLYDHKIKFPGPKFFKRLLGEKFGDSIKLGRKINSLIYYLKFYVFVVMNAYYIFRRQRKSFLLITYILSPYSLLLGWICRTLNIKYSIALHGLDFILASKKFPNQLKKICEYADLIIFNSYATQERFAALGISCSGNNYILYPGIPCKELHDLSLLNNELLSESLKVNTDEKLVVSSVARLVKRKGFDLAIKAVSLASSDFIYLVAGTGPELSSLEKLVQSLNLSKKVFLLGYVNDLQKYSLMSLSSIFLMPNHSQGRQDFEGFGINLVEASYFNNVIIAGNYGGTVESVKHGESGFLVDTEESDAACQIANHIDILISQKKVRKKLAYSAKDYAVENFCTNSLTVRFVEYLRKNNFLNPNCVAGQ